MIQKKIFPHVIPARIGNKEYNYVKQTLLVSKILNIETSLVKLMSILQ